MPADRGMRTSRIARFAGLSLATLLLASCSMLPGGGRPKPIPDRPIDIDGHCAQTEDDGYGERARLLVRRNKVQALSWEITAGRHGSCRFEQSGFRQTKSSPHVELAARDGSDCRLMIWQDPRRITMAHAGCERHCSPPAVIQRTWPVMFDARTGRCAR